MKNWGFIALHAAVAAAFIFCCSAIALNASLESSLLWALTFGGAPPGSPTRSPIADVGKYCMLDDKDRIFSNLYGLARLGPRGRAPPRRLGRHQGDHRQGPRLDHQRDEGLGPARPRRGRVSRPA